jgi:hypothetical protein
VRIARMVEEEIPALPSIAITVSLQHRSPPLSLSWSARTLLKN